MKHFDYILKEENIEVKIKATIIDDNEQRRLVVIPSLGYEVAYITFTPSQFSSSIVINSLKVIDGEFINLKEEDPEGYLDILAVISKLEGKNRFIWDKALILNVFLQETPTLFRTMGVAFNGNPVVVHHVKSEDSKVFMYDETNRKYSPVSHDEVREVTQQALRLKTTAGIPFDWILRKEGTYTYNSYIEAVQNMLNA